MASNLTFDPWFFTVWVYFGTSTSSPFTVFLTVNSFPSLSVWVNVNENWSSLSSSGVKFFSAEICAVPLAVYSLVNVATLNGSAISFLVPSSFTSVRYSVATTLSLPFLLGSVISTVIS